MSTLPAETSSQGHCKAQPLSSSSEATSQQLLPWSLGSCLPTSSTSITPDTQLLLQRYQTISRCSLISDIFPHSWSSDTSHYHLQALLHQASICSLSLSLFIVPFFLLFPTPLSDVQSDEGSSMQTLKHNLSLLPVHQAVCWTKPRSF